MSRQVNGMHVSNFRHWHVEKLHQCSHDDGAATILHFLMRDDPTIPQWSDSENVNWFIKLRHGWAPQDIPPAPRRLVHVRMYHPNWSARSAEEWARHTVDMLSNIEAKDTSGQSFGQFNLWTDPYVTVSPANEQNLHYENGDADAGNQWKYRTVEHYARAADWNARWAREVKRLVPNRRATLTWPAFAYGHDPVAKRMDGAPVPEWEQYAVTDGEYKIPEVRQAIAEYEIMATHPYGHLNWAEPEATRTVTWGEKDALYHLYRDFRSTGYGGPHDPGGALAQIGEKPFLVTECGTFAHSDSHKTQQNIDLMQEFLDRCAQTGRFLGVTWFIWSTNDAHQENNFMNNPDLRDAVAVFPKVETALAVPAPSVDEPPEPHPDEQRDEWILRQAEELHERSGVRINPDSALIRASGVAVDSWLPTTNEHSAIFEADSESYTLQRFEIPETSTVKVVYFRTGQWDQPHEVYRGTIPAGPAHDAQGFGIDVSHHNGQIDWAAAAAAAVDFVIIKATEGWSWVDPRFEENAGNSRGVIGLRGPYHFYSNSARKPVSQARHFAETIAAYQWELPPAVDLEDSSAPFRSREFREFLERVEDLTGVRPIIYGARWYVHGRTRRLNSYVNRYWQWVADYGDEMNAPSDWANIVMWQYSAKGDGPAHGVAGEHVDLNRTVEPFTLADLAVLKDRVPPVG